METIRLKLAIRWGQLGVIFLSVIATALHLSASGAWASYLTISGNSTLKLEMGEHEGRITGSYKIENLGDELARDVFPSITIGTWQWAGEPHALNPKEAFSWQITQNFSLDALRCQAAACAGKELPRKGNIPLLVHRNYQDQNGYQFSAAEVQIIPLGELTVEEFATLRVPDLAGKLQFVGNGQEFTGELQIQNTTPETKQVSVRYFTSREIQILSEPQFVEVKPNAISAVKFNAKNFRGLNGSSYGTFAVLEWESHGLRKTLSVGAPIPLKEPDHTINYLLIILMLLIVLPILLYFSVFRGGRLRS